MLNLSDSPGIMVATEGCRRVLHGVGNAAEVELVVRAGGKMKIACARSSM